MANPSPPAVPQPSIARSLLNPTALSFFYPGLGQAVQKRFVMAAVYFITCSACVCIFLFSVAKILHQAYSIWDPDFEISNNLPVIPLIFSFLGVLFIWGISLVDAFLINRSRKKSAMKQPENAKQEAKTEPSSVG